MAKAVRNKSCTVTTQQDAVKVLHQLCHLHAQNDAEIIEHASNLFSEYIAEENFSRFSLDAAARQFGLDKYKFLRLFKDQTGFTPNNYTIFKRVEKSKLLLAQGQDLLSIAVELGFYDAAHYCNHFKKFTGVSPSAFIADL